MFIKKSGQIKDTEITDKSQYLNRRAFLQGLALTGSVFATGSIYKLLNRTPEVKHGVPIDGVIRSTLALPAADKPTSFEHITTYNNFYEFCVDKRLVAEKASGFIASPWKVEVGGLVNKPRAFDLDDLMKIAPLEERIYRFRCVEGWSMVIPWVGFPLSALLAIVEPNSKACYLSFETLMAPERMPNQKTDTLPWPYVEGLRLDEAMHPLTLLATGIYGETLLPQDGAPVRLVVPWKYGFKSIKSIVGIRLLETQPPTTWNKKRPQAYGFYSNVNPNVPHPRWSQATEHPIGQFERRPTLLYNGYADQVAHLYAGMDLKKNY